MKKVMVHAVSKLNLGDDLFLKILFERYPNTKFVTIMPSEYKEKYNYPNLKIYSSTNIFYRGIHYFMNKCNIYSVVPRLISKFCDASVHIGGSIYQQRNTWKKQIKRRKSIFVKNQPFYVMGANFGPYNFEEYYYRYKQIFSKYEDICFRDNFSYNLFKDLNNVRKADDIVFSLKNNNNCKMENNIIISVIKPSHRPYLSQSDVIYYEKLKEVVKGFINKEYTITLMSFCKDEGDEEGINQLMKRIPKKHKEHIDTYKYRGDIDEALQIISSSRYMIATRFHAMILGWLYNKPTLPIAYSEKMTNVMNDVGYNGMYIDFTNLDDLQFDKVYDDLKTNSVNISKQIVNSEKHFKKLDEFLKGNNY